MEEKKKKKRLVDYLKDKKFVKLIKRMIEMENKIYRDGNYDV